MMGALLDSQGNLLHELIGSDSLSCWIDLTNTVCAGCTTPGDNECQQVQYPTDADWPPDLAQR